MLVFTTLQKIRPDNPGDSVGGEIPPLLDREYWPFRQDWLDYVNQNWKGVGRVELVSDDSLERLSFLKAATEAFLRKGIKFNYVKTYLSVQVPKYEIEYDDQYPHTHEPAFATTLVHYLQPGDIPAPLDIFIGDVVTEQIKPEPGLTVFIPNHIKHGVWKNNGTQNRVQLIATAR